MTKMLRAALPLATMLVVPLAGLEAREPTPEMVVIAPADAEVRAWSSRVGEAIDAKMRYPRSLGPSRTAEGIVDVTFECSDDGRPSKVAVARTSGSRQLDAAGMRAIQRVATLHPLPAGIGHGQVYKARLLFAMEGSDLARKAAALREEADRGNAALAQRRGVASTASVITLVARAP